MKIRILVLHLFKVHCVSFKCQRQEKIIININYYIHKYFMSDNEVT